jgi:hypothetical protein
MFRVAAITSTLTLSGRSLAPWRSALNDLWDSAEGVTKSEFLHLLGERCLRVAATRDGPRYLQFGARRYAVDETVEAISVDNYGGTCWELDAMDPRDLRNLVEQAIRGEIEWEAWRRCEVVEKAERESLQHVLDAWKGIRPEGAEEQIETVGSKIVRQTPLWLHET